MLTHYIQPSGLLREYILDYCFMESIPGEEDIIERVVPSAGVQIMFHYKNPFIVYDQANISWMQPRSIITGLRKTFCDVSTSGETGVVFVTFKPLGACHFLRFPVNEIENLSLNLNDLTNGVHQVEESLADSLTIAEKVLRGQTGFRLIAITSSNIVEEVLELTHTSLDTMENIDMSLVEATARFVDTMIRKY